MIPEIPPPDHEAGARARGRFDEKTKPLGSLGRLEDLVPRIAAARRTADLRPLEPALVLVAGDHGYAEEGVSAYPSEVTGQMLANFVEGGAAVNVLARRSGMRLVVVDAGVNGDASLPGVRRLRLGAGTANGSRGPAMERSAAERGIDYGLELARELSGEGVGLVALGDMGIANTTAASALAAALLPADPALVCGYGTGIDDEGLARKIEVVRKAIDVNHGQIADPIGALAAVGGFEHAVLAGVCLGAAARALVVLLDGFVTSTAALVAARLAPQSVARMIAAHRSPEPGHARVLDDLGLEPLLDLGLRLGEGSGAALALHLVEDALALFAEMATFEEASVARR